MFIFWTTALLGLCQQGLSQGGGGSVVRLSLIAGLVDCMFKWLQLTL